MADNNIDFVVSGKANFDSVYSELNKLKTQINEVSKAAAATSSINIDTRKIQSYEKQFLDTAASIKGVRVQMVGLADGAAHLSERLLGNKRTFSEMMSTWRAGSKQLTDDMKRIGEYQAKLNESMVIPSAVGNGQAAVITNLGKVADGTLSATKALQAYNTEMMNLGNKMVNFGKNTQWAGRQLTVGLTVPLMAAGGAISAMFLKVDESMRKLMMVYGMGGPAGQKFSNIAPSVSELNAIAEGVNNLSIQMAKMYGQSAEMTTAVAADLAAAGYTQQQLLEMTKITTDAMVLGQTDQQSAVKATIALQNAYRLSSMQTGEALQFFSAAQAATSTSMKDLIDAIPRVGPIVQNLNGTYKDTVAMIVAMKEGGVAAGEAANALKNSLQRIVAPTKSASETLGKFGIDLKDIANSDNPVIMIEKLQNALLKLSPVSRQVAITELFGKFQAARMTALLDNFNRSGTQSAKVMDMMSLSAQQLADMQGRQIEQLQQSPSMRFQSAIEGLKTQLIPIGQKLIEIVTPLINGLTWIIQALDKIGPIKYLLAGGLGFTAVLGPLIMFGGLISNLVGQMFKIGQQIRMFRQGFTEGGGFARPFSALKEGLKATQNYLEEFNAAEYASKQSSEQLSLSIDEQANSFRELTKAMAEYRQELAALASGTKVPGLPGTGGPGIPPGGGAPYPRVPIVGPMSPMGIVGEASRPIKVEALEVRLSNQRGKLELDGGGGIEFSHMRPTQQTMQGSNVLGIPGYDPRRNAQGSFGIVPGYMTPTTGIGKDINQTLQDRGGLPIVPTGMNSQDVVRQILTDLGIRNITDAVVQQAMQELSIENIGGAEAGKLAQMRALSMLQGNPAAIGQFRSLTSSPEATGADVEAFFAQQLGSSWEDIKQQAAQEILHLYEIAQQETADAIQAGTVAPQNLMEQLSLTGARLSELVSEQYNQIVATFEASFAKSMTIDSTQFDNITEQMKRKLSVRLVNAGATTSGMMDTLTVAIESLIQQARGIISQLTSEARTATAQVAAMSSRGAAQGLSAARRVAVGQTPTPLATGGKVYGPGGPKDDLIPALLSDGEYVVKADAVGHYGSGFLDAINHKKLAGGGIASFKSGADVRRPSHLGMSRNNPKSTWATESAPLIQGNESYVQALAVAHGIDPEFIRTATPQQLSQALALNLSHERRIKDKKNRSVYVPGQVQTAPAELNQILEVMAQSNLPVFPMVLARHGQFTNDGKGFKEAIEILRILNSIRPDQLNWENAFGIKTPQEKVRAIRVSRNYLQRLTSLGMQGFIDTTTTLDTLASELIPIHNKLTAPSVEDVISIGGRALGLARGGIARFMAGTGGGLPGGYTQQWNASSMGQWTDPNNPDFIPGQLPMFMTLQEMLDFANFNTGDIKRGESRKLEDLWGRKLSEAEKRGILRSIQEMGFAGGIKMRIPPASGAPRVQVGRNRWMTEAPEFLSHHRMAALMSLFPADVAGDTMFPVDFVEGTHADVSRATRLGGNPALNAATGNESLLERLGMLDRWKDIQRGMFGGGIARFAEGPEPTRSGGYSAAAVAAMMNAREQAAGGKEVYTPEEIEAILRSPDSPLMGQNVEEFFASRAAGEASRMPVHGPGGVLEMMSGAVEHVRNTGEFVVQDGSGATAALADIMWKHAHGDKSGWKEKTDEQIQSGAVALQTYLASLPGDTMRLYRSITLDDENAVFAPGHFGTAPIDILDEMGQRFISFSTGVRVPANFARPDSVGHTPRIVEIDVPKSAIVGIDKVNYNTGAYSLEKPEGFQEQEVIVDKQKLGDAIIRYINPSGLASPGTAPVTNINEEHGVDEFLGALQPKGSDVDRLFEDMIQRARRGAGSGGQGISLQHVPGWQDALNPENQGPLFGITQAEVDIARRYLESTYGMPVSELKKQKNEYLIRDIVTDRARAAKPGARLQPNRYLIDRDTRLLDIVAKAAGLRQQIPSMPVHFTDEPGKTSLIWGEERISGRGAMPNLTTKVLAKNLQRRDIVYPESTVRKITQTPDGMIEVLFTHGETKLFNPEELVQIHKPIVKEPEPEQWAEIPGTPSGMAKGGFLSRFAKGGIAKFSQGHGSWARQALEQALQDQTQENYHITSLDHALRIISGGVRGLDPTMEDRVAAEGTGFYTGDDNAKLQELYGGAQRVTLIGRAIAPKIYEMSEEEFQSLKGRSTEFEVLSKALAEQGYTAMRMPMTNGAKMTKYISENAFVPEKMTFMRPNYKTGGSTLESINVAQLIGLSPEEILYRMGIDPEFARKELGSKIAEMPIDPSKLSMESVIAQETAAMFPDAEEQHQQNRNAALGVDVETARSRMLRNFERLAFGGKVYGPGGPKDDVIPAMISNGEYVVNADAVGHYGVGFMDAVNSKKLAGGGLARFAGGSGGTRINPFTGMPIVDASATPELAKANSEYVKAIKEAAETYKKESESIKDSIKAEEELTEKKKTHSDIIKEQILSGESSNEADASVSDSEGNAEPKKKSRFTRLKEGYQSKFGAGTLGGMAMSQGLGIAGNLLGSAVQSDEGPTAGSQALQFGSSAYQMTSFLGPEISLPITAAASLIGAAMGDMEEKARELAKRMEEANKKSAELTSQFKISAEAMQQFGITISSFSSIKLGESSKQVNDFQAAVDQLSMALKESANPATQALINSLRGKDTEAQNATLLTQGRLILAATKSLEKSKQNILALGQVSGTSIITQNQALADLANEYKTSKKEKSDVQISSYLKVFDQKMKLPTTPKLELTQKGIDALANATGRSGMTSWYQTAGLGVEDMVGKFGSWMGEKVLGGAADFANAIATRSGGKPNAERFEFNPNASFGFYNAKATDWGKDALALQDPNKKFLEEIAPRMYGAPEGFRLSNIATMKPEALTNALNEYQTKTATDLLNSSDVNIAGLAKAAGVTEKTNTAEAIRMMTELGNKLNALSNDGKNSIETLNDWQNSISEFNAKTVGVIQQAMSSLNPQQFEKFVSQIGALNVAFNDLDPVGKQLVSTIAESVGPEFVKLQKELEMDGGSVKNFVSALSLLKNGLNLNESQVRGISKDLSGRMLDAAQKQMLFMNAQDSQGQAIAEAAGAYSPAQRDLDTINDAIKARQDQYKNDQRASQDAFKAEQEAQQEKVKVHQKTIEGIQKELDARQKLYDAKQKEIQQDQTLFGLQNKISAARNSGDLLALAAAQNEYNNEVNRQNELKAKEKADALDQSKITAEQDKIKAIQDQMEAAQKAYDKKMQAMQDQYDADMESLQKKLDAAQKAVNTPEEEAAKNERMANAQIAYNDALETLATLDPKKYGGKTLADILKIPSDQAEPAVKRIQDDFRQIKTLTGQTTEEIAKQSEWVWKREADWVNTNIKFAVDGTGTITQIGIGDGNDGAQLKVDTNGNIVIVKTTAQGTNVVKFNGNSSPTTSNVTTSQGTYFTSPYGAMPRAEGGHVRGPGTETSDSIPALLSDNEYVVKASSVRKYGKGFMDAINAGRYAKGGIVKDNDRDYIGDDGEAGASQPDVGGGTVSTSSPTRINTDWAPPVPEKNNTNGLWYNKGGFHRESWTWGGTPLFPATGVNDIHADYGDSFRALLAGKVDVASEWGSYYPGYVVLTHADGSQTRYAHQHPIVSEGQYVQAGEVLGHAGMMKSNTSGHPDGQEHLHFAWKQFPRLIQRGSGGTVPWYKDDGSSVFDGAAPTDFMGGMNGSFGGGMFDGTQFANPTINDLSDSGKMSLINMLGFGWPNDGNKSIKFPMILGNASQFIGGVNTSMPISVGGKYGRYIRGTQLVDLIKSAGWTGENVRIGYGIVMGESGGDTLGQNSNKGSSSGAARDNIDWGLWQINDYWNREVNGETVDWSRITDPVYNTHIAMQSFLRAGGRTNAEKAWREEWNSFRDKTSAYMEGLREFDRLGVGMAEGGSIFGPGGPKDDKIPAMLSNGEFVVRAAAVSKYGRQMLEAINNGSFDQKFANPMARTGVVDPSSVSSSSSSTMQNIEYNVNVSVAGTNASPDEIANVVIRTLKQREKANMTQRTIG